MNSTFLVHEMPINVSLSPSSMLMNLLPDFARDLKEDYFYIKIRSLFFIILQGK